MKKYIPRIIDKELKNRLEAKGAVLIEELNDTGKPIILILSVKAEIEQINILVKTMEGRKPKARESKWYLEAILKLLTEQKGIRNIQQLAEKNIDVLYQK